MKRRGVLEAVVLAATTGCLSSAGDPAVEVMETYNSAVELREGAHEDAAAAQRAWDRAAWREAEDRFNEARSGFERAAGRFSEASAEGEACPRLGRWADESFAYCLRMERACTAWMRAADAYRRDRPQRGADFRADGDERAAAARAYPHHPAVEPTDFDCRT